MAIKAITLPLSTLMAVRTFSSLKFKKIFFSLIGRLFTPHPVFMKRPLKKRIFLYGFPNFVQYKMNSSNKLHVLLMIKEAPVIRSDLNSTILKRKLNPFLNNETQGSFAQGRIQSFRQRERGGGG